MSATANKKFELDYFNQILPHEKLAQLAADNSERFQTAQPVPNIVFDDVFDADFLRAVAKEFPERENSNWQTFDNQREKKLASSDDLQLGPCARALIANLNSGSFIQFLEELTGIEGLIPDPHLSGGGMHRILPGGKLSLHVDFNQNEKLKVERRLNLLIYLNEDWEEDFGGHFELWDKKMTKPEVRILPVFNRMAMFETSKDSWHGHPDALSCPENRSRRSIALYYYTSTKGGNQNNKIHTTIFRERPNEELFNDIEPETAVEKLKNTLRPLVNKFRGQ